jgi:hypothetical protein
MVTQYGDLHHWLLLQLKAILHFSMEYIELTLAHSLYYKGLFEEDVERGTHDLELIKFDILGTKPVFHQGKSFLLQT